MVYYDDTGGPGNKGISYLMGFETHIVLPYWLLVAASAIGPLFWLADFRRNRVLHMPQKLCGICGYDLTGILSGICPECGSKIVTK